MLLDPAVASSGTRLVARGEVGSTNTEALMLAHAGESGPLWITATRQSAGRGRRGRAWLSEPGNLYASLLLSDPSPADRAPELSFVAGLAVHDAVVAVAPDAARRLALKWPNDVLIDGQKFSGILIEGEGTAVVVGIGVNCAHHPAQTLFPATDLAAAGTAVTPETLFEKLSATLAQRLTQWDRGTGFDAIRADWLARAFKLGEPLRVQTPEGERTGRFETIDERGRLVLKLSGGTTEIVTAGDVFSLSTQTHAAATGCRS